MSQIVSKLIHDAKEKRLTRLNLNNFECHKIPEELFELAWLEELDLAGNKITDLQPLENITNLAYLNLTGNQIADLRSLEKLANLTHLNLAENKITDLHPLENITKLAYLNLAGNQIADLRPLEKLTNLTHLELTENEITDLQPLENITKLIYLNLAGNRVADLRPLKKLTNLTNLGLTRNKIADLQPLENITKLIYLNLAVNQIADLRPLEVFIEKGIPIICESDYEVEGIMLEGNPLTTPPLEVIKQGNEAVLNYFRELEQQGSEFLYEAKLLLIGEGGAGKTTLARKLINKDSSTPGEEATQGIAIEKYEFSDSRGRIITVNIWDFGGQEIYHATHQFFLTKRSLYILVDGNRSSDQTINDVSFNYWLQTVALYGGGSPLIIVQNKKYDRSKKLDIKGMRGRFDFITEYLETNLTTTEGMEKVKNAIHYHIQNLPHIGEKLPKTWAIIHKELQELSVVKDYISLEEFLNICYKHDIREKKHALLLSSYLHDLGAFLHFQGDPILENIFILNNLWPLDAVYRVLNNEKIIKNLGHFTQSDLKEIWNDENHKYRYSELLALMTRFEICYVLKDLPEITMIAPQLLPVEAPAIDWDFKNNLIIRYTYDLMPKGLLFRFIIRNHRLIKNPFLMWRMGLVMERQNTEALIIENYVSREITIRTKGSQSRELITIITDDFDQIQNQYKNLNYQKLIPCNCSICRGSENPNFYEYNVLLKRRELGRITVECYISFEDVSISGLLDGLFVPNELARLDEAGLHNSKQILKIFLSYAHEDEKMVQELIKHLSPLESTEEIKIFNERKFNPATNWDKRLENEITESTIFLFFISSDLLAKDFLWRNELNMIMKLKQTKKVKIIPIVLRACAWEVTPLSKFSALPKKKTPISSFANKDEAYTEIAFELTKVINGLKLDSIESFQSSGDRFNRKGDDFFSQGDFNKATTEFTKAIKEYINEKKEVIAAECYNKIGECFLRLSNSFTAVENYIESALINQKYEKWAKAIDIYLTCLPLLGDTFSENWNKLELKIWENLSTCYDKTKNFPERDKANSKFKILMESFLFKANLRRIPLIKKIEVYSIEPFGRIKWKLQPQINVLLGKNGYGKSYLLQLIAYHLDPKNEDGIDITEQFFEKIKIDNAYFEIEFQDDFEREFVRDNLELFTIRNKAGFKNYRGKVPLLAVSGMRYINKTKREIESSNVFEGGLKIHGARDFIGQNPSEDMVNYLLYTLGDECYKLKLKNSNLPTIISEAPLVNMVQTLMKSLTDNNFEFKDVEKVPGEPRLRIIVKSEGNEIPIQAASQGTLSVLVIFGLIYNFLESVYESVKKNELLQQSAIVIIDEIDAHLHPSWQQKIIGLLRNNFPKVQFILTAHSPLIAAGCFENEVTMLQKGTSSLYQFPNDFIGYSAEELYSIISKVEDEDESYLFYLSETPFLKNYELKVKELMEKDKKTDAEQKELNELCNEIFYIKRAEQKFKERSELENLKMENTVLKEIALKSKI